MMTYDNYPAVDANYNFPPEVRGALAKSVELRNTVVQMTETDRNNLTTAELWDGRLILNTTAERINRYDAASGQWITIAEQGDAILFYTQVQRDNLTGPALFNDRLIMNTTTNRINRYDEATATWVEIVEPDDLYLVLTTDEIPAVNAGNGSIGTSTKASRADHSHPGPASAQTDIFTASGTWTKPPNAKRVEVHIWGGGGSGSDNGGSLTNTPGGAGGGCVIHTFDATELSATVPVTVGSGGIAQSGNAGVAGGSSSFGSYITVTGGQGGGASSSGTITSAVGGGTGPYYGGGSGNSKADLSGGDSVEGGGGGGFASWNSGKPGGYSVGGGKGGTGGSSTVAPVPASIPGGGGGGSKGTGLGHGARGEVRIYTSF